MTEFSMWSQRHQPTTLDECILDAFPEFVKRQLLHASQQTILPNLLLYGISGTGKSTIARVLCDKTRHDVCWFNGSLITKDNIPQLAHLAKSGNLFFDRRVIFIDEADGMSLPAQYALRSLIEPDNAGTWILTCNYRKKLIEPIASRFMQIECSLPPQSEREKHIAAIVRRCQQILRVERISNVTENELYDLVAAKYPDVRAIINELQLRYSFLAEAA